MINMDPKTTTVGVQIEKTFVMQILKETSPVDYERIFSEIETEKKEKEKLSDAPAGPVYLTDSNFDEALKKYGSLVVDFWAEWCMPCKMLAPILEEIALEQKGKIVIGKLNVDENPAVSHRYGIMSIPAVYFFKNGEKAGESVGVIPKQQLTERIKAALKI